LLSRHIRQTLNGVSGVTTKTGGGTTTKALNDAWRSFLRLFMHTMHLLRKPSGESARVCQQALVSGLTTLQPVQAFDEVSGAKVQGTFFFDSA
jgi:hypothetical protein